jgi:integrase
MIDGKEHYQNLQVRIRGSRPARLKDTGSVQFENSRGEAQAAFDKLMDEIQSGRGEEQLREAVYEARSGEKLKRYRIQDIPQIWIDKPRKRKPSERHYNQEVSKLQRFSGWLEANYPEIVRVDQLRPMHVQAFLDTLEGDGVTGDTWNKYLVLIRSVLKRAGVPAARDILQKDTETVSRHPFAVDELQAIFDAAKANEPLIYSLAVTAACTAMRKKDCCHLRWSDVDMVEGFITVKTSKTGQVVDIPLADILLEEIRKREGNESEYVFPEAARLYKTNPDGISCRFKKVLELAGFDTGNPVPRGELKSDPCTLEEMNEAAAKAFSAEKLERVKKVLAVYLSGEGVKATAKTTGFSVSTVSTYLNELEAVTGKAIVRGKRRPPKCLQQQPTRGAIRAKRDAGKNRASLRDFHSFRTTFVTLALMRGMPLDIVRKITGHKTADVVMKHYFRPQRAELRAAMQKTMPGLLTSAAKPTTPDARAADLLRTAKAENWQAVIDEALVILEGGVVA